MFCKNCGEKIDDNSKFCSSCGHQFIAESKTTMNNENIGCLSKEKKDGLSNFSLFLSVTSALFPIGIVLGAPLLGQIGLFAIIPAFVVSTIALISALIKFKKIHKKRSCFLKRIIAFSISIISILVLMGVFNSSNMMGTTNTNEDTKTGGNINNGAPIKMTAEYVGDDNRYGSKIFDDDFCVYLHWSDGTKKSSKKFIVENEDCYLKPENTVKTFNLKSTEYDLRTSVDIQIPAIQSFPNSRDEFCSKYYELMKGAGITQYTMELKTAENGNIVGANFRDYKGAYWYFLSFKNQTNNNSIDFDEVRLETNVQYNRAEMEKMKLLLISLTIPANTYTPTSAYTLLQENDGDLVAGDVKYSAYFASKGSITGSTNYYILAYVTQLPVYSVGSNAN